jgi:hypothetical protein
MGLAYPGQVPGGRDGTGENGGAEVLAPSDGTGAVVVLTVTAGDAGDAEGLPGGDDAAGAAVALTGTAGGDGAGLACTGAGTGARLTAGAGRYSGADE